MIEVWPVAAFRMTRLPGISIRHFSKTILSLIIRISRARLATGKLDSPGYDQPRPDASEREGGLSQRLDSYEKEIIESCLNQNRWHRARTAESLGIDRKTLYTRMKAFGLNFPKKG